jgi:endonuclease-3
VPDTALVRRARKINRVLAETYPDAHIELDFDNPFELLVVTVLSAQTTDRRVNAVRPTLFAAYPDATAMAAADRAKLEQIIQPTGFFRAKTESLIKLSQALVERYDGQVPATLEDLVTLPGVGRKTAACVLLFAYGLRDVPVDTHVGRVATRLALLRPGARSEEQHDAMLALTPPGAELEFHVNLLRHGRRLCHAQRPNCLVCPLRRMCPGRHA